MEELLLVGTRWRACSRAFQISYKQSENRRRGTKREDEGKGGKEEGEEEVKAKSACFPRALQERGSQCCGEGQKVDGDARRRRRADVETRGRGGKKKGQRERSETVRVLRFDELQWLSYYQSCRRPTTSGKEKTKEKGRATR
jgi:hypothetical protein